jgi:hypothetical protein
MTFPNVILPSAALRSADDAKFRSSHRRAIALSSHRNESGDICASLFSNRGCSTMKIIKRHLKSATALVAAASLLQPV